MRWFSHEVADLEPVLRMLLAQDCRDHEVGGWGMERGRGKEIGRGRGGRW